MKTSKKEIQEKLNFLIGECVKSLIKSDSKKIKKSIKRASKGIAKSIMRTIENSDGQIGLNMKNSTEKTAPKKIVRRRRRSVAQNPVKKTNPPVKSNQVKTNKITGGLPKSDSITVKAPVETQKN